MPGNRNADMAWRGMAGSPFAKAATPRPTSGRVYRAVLLRGAEHEDTAAPEPTQGRPG
jgi:hypothetical protein